MKKHNFSAGPCILPQQVLLEASDVRNALAPVVSEIIEAVRI